MLMNVFGILCIGNHPTTKKSKMMVQKIVPTEEELKPTTSESVVKNRKRHFAKKGTVNQFHCSVDGCIYGPTTERHFSCMKYLKQHYRKVHAEKIFSCSKCQMKFAVTSDFKAHEIVCGKQFNCSCGSVFNKREALLTHAYRKQHELPAEQRLKRKPQITAVATEVPNTSKPTIVVVFDNTTSSSLPNTTTTVRKPCLILPKPAPLSTVPLKTVAAMALSELSNCQFSNAKRTTTTQTEGLGSCSCRTVKHDTQMKRAAKRSSETQTLTRNKRQRREVTSCSTQTKKSKTIVTVPSKEPSRSEMTQTEPFLSYDNDVYQRNDNQFLWQMSDDGSLTMTDKLCQTINDLDIDVNFQLVSSGTQTSPRTMRFVPKNPICDSFLDSPLRNYLALDNLAEYQLPLSVCEEAETVRQQLSSIETQTEVDFEALLMCGGGAESEMPNEADIQTQTSEDLESIPYDQLLSHMETQTSDLFTELGNFCNIQTQTVYDFNNANTSSSLVDIQTQTNSNVTLRNGQGEGGATTAQLTNMETQTFLSFLEMVETPSLLS